MGPSHRGETIMFSKNALISLRNGSLYLMVRLADLRPSHLIECHVSGHFLAKKTTEEGEVVPYHLETMKFGSSMEDEDSDYLQLFFPLVVAHKIDASSPLFELSPKDLQAMQFEIILSLEGTTPETGNTIQVFIFTKFCLFVRKLFEVISLFRCEHLTCQVKYYGV